MWQISRRICKAAFIFSFFVPVKSVLPMGWAPLELPVHQEEPLYHRTPDNRSIANMILEGLRAKSETALSPSSVLLLLQHLQREEMHNKLREFGVDSQALSTEIVSRLLTQQRPVGSSIQSVEKSALKSGDDQIVSQVQHNDQRDPPAGISSLGDSDVAETRYNLSVLATRVADDLATRGFAAVLSKEQLRRVLERTAPTLRGLNIDPDDFNKMVESRLAERSFSQQSAKGDALNSPSVQSNVKFRSPESTSSTSPKDETALSFLEVPVAAAPSLALEENLVPSLDTQSKSRLSAVRADTEQGELESVKVSKENEIHPEKLGVEVTAAPTLPEINCIREGFDLQGVDLRKMENGTMKTAAECYAECLLFPGCNAWTFNGSRGWCYLKRATEKDFTKSWNHSDTLVSAIIDCKLETFLPHGRRLSLSSNGSMRVTTAQTPQTDKTKNPASAIPAFPKVNIGLTAFARSLSAVTEILQSVLNFPAVETAEPNETESAGFLVRQ